MTIKQVDFRADVRPEDSWTATVYTSIPVTGVIAVYEPDGQPVIQKVTIWAPIRDEGHGVTRAVLRCVADEIEQVLVEAMRQAGYVEPGVEAEQEFRRRRGLSDPVQRREMDESHLSRVAAAYRDAHGRGFSGLRYVMKSFNCSKSTAARWVAEARKTGLLEPRELRERGEPT